MTKGIAQDIWSIGDTIAIELDGTVDLLTFSKETYYAFIFGFDHNKNLETEGKHSITLGFGKTADGTDIAFIDSGYNTSSGTSTGFKMNIDSTNKNGWESSYMRQTICPAFYNILPSDWQDVISTITKYTDNTGNHSNTDAEISATEDQIFLLAEYEILGSRSYANIYEQNYQQQYDYYTAGNNVIRYRHSATSSTCAWWSRSAYYNDGSSFRAVSSSGGNPNSNGATISYGFAPAFCIIAD